MRILAVDDEKLMLERLVRCITEAVPQAEVVSFQKATECLAYAMKEQVDVAFLDIRMRMMDGMELARQIKLLQPKINIIFTTGYSDYIYDAVSEIRCSGYVLKPVTTEQIRRELDNLRHPIEQQSGAKVHMQCFGNFEVFIDGKPVKFKYELTKEMLAYLVDRNGAFCTNGELMAVLWGDKASSSYFRSLIKDLKDVLDQAGCADIIIQQRGKIGIVRQNVDCDYFDWLDGKPYAMNLYHGEYMSQYSWGEFTNASIRN